MVFVACGLNYKTAPLAIREQTILSVDEQDLLISQLISQALAYEVVILSTCNRTELYCKTENPELLKIWLIEQPLSIFSQFASYLYYYVGLEAMQHALRVASGLDSMMLGEPQILGQMKQAYHQACKSGYVKKQLRPTFEYIFSSSKRIRTLSNIGSNPVSVAYTAVQLIGKFFHSYHPLNVLIIGSGETASLVAKYLFRQGVRTFYVASRTLDNAQRLAANFNGTGLTITEIPDYLKKADVVVSATACPLPFINKKLVESALSSRVKSPMFFLDLSVPRDIDLNVNDIENVHLYNIDDLHLLIDKGIKERQISALNAEQLIAEELHKYDRWHRSQRANDMICDYRNHMQNLAEIEFSRAQNQLAEGLNQEAVLRQFCDRLVKKLVHTPTIGLKQAASDGREELLDLTHYLFNVSIDPITL